jgi:hypothetical protein
MRVDVKHCITAVLFLFVLTDAVPAQQAGAAPAAPAPAPRAQAAPGSAPPPAAPRTQAPSPAPPPAGAAPATRPPTPFANDPINVRYEITVREEGGTDPKTKTVVMSATLYEISLVRALSGPRATPFAVDVNPTGLRDTKVRTKLSIEYTPVTTDPKEVAAPGLNVRQTVHVWLDSGKPMIVSQSSDPATDRRVIVEVTATILK